MNDELTAASLLEVGFDPVLLKRKLTLATAESCLGKSIGRRLIAAPDSANYFPGGISLT